MSGEENSQGGEVLLFSFGFKYGVPTDVNLLFDVRCLSNPYWVERLRPKTGLEPEVARFVLEDTVGQEFRERVFPALETLVAQHLKKDRRRLRVGIGCTGGRHRSVATVEAVAASLRERGYSVIVYHRDIGRDAG